MLSKKIRKSGKYPRRNGFPKRIYTPRSKGVRICCTYASPVITTNGVGLVDNYADVGVAITASNQFTTLQGVFKRFKCTYAIVKWIPNNENSSANGAQVMGVAYNPGVTSAPGGLTNVLDNESSKVFNNTSVTTLGFKPRPTILAEWLSTTQAGTQANLYGGIQFYCNSGSISIALGQFIIKFYLICDYQS